MKTKNIWIISGVVLVIVAAVVITILLMVKPGHKSNEELYSSIPSEIPGEVLYIPFPVKINVDGDLSDWNGLPSNYVDTGPMPSPDPLENGSFTFSVAADMDNFYITMQMPDKNIIAGEHGIEFWNEDSMEFYINASDELNARVYGPKIFQANVNAADIGNSDPDGLTITGVYSSDVQVRGFVFATTDGWAFEAAVPLADLLTPEHGREIGFQAQINGASTQDRDIKLIWSKADTTDASWQSPKIFGSAIFYELGRTGIPQSSREVALETEVPTDTPVVVPAQVSVNQTGYFPTGKKIASIALDSPSEVEWDLRNRNGEVVLSGLTSLKGEDASSGDFLQLIDFSAYETPGSGYQVSAAGLISVPFDISTKIYNQLKLDALAYFYLSRSGIPILAQYSSDTWARDAGHLTDDNVTCYRGVDADGNSWPGCNYSLDVSRGWYDAGDFGKYVVNGGISAWTLMNLYEHFPDVYPDGSLSIPEQGNGVSDLLDEIRWEMEFLLSMQVPQGQPQAGMVHHKIHDLTWAAMPMVPPSQVDNNSNFDETGVGRYLYPPSTAATLNLAATAAECARIWVPIDPAFSERCLDAAETAWQAALENPAVIAGNTPGAGGGNYDDTQVSDEFYWAAAELFITTGKDEYSTYLVQSDLFADVESFDWGHTAPLGTLELATSINNLPPDKADFLKEKVISYADELITVQIEDGYSVLINGDYPWGSNGLILNNMILMGTAYDLSNDGKYLDSVRLSMDYILGRNPMNFSYVSGYGTNSLQHPHHRFWANDPTNGYPPPPPGVVSGGPNSFPSDPPALNADLAAKAPSKRYLDEIGSFSTNEVAINWNAPLAWVATFLDESNR